MRSSRQDAGGVSMWPRSGGKIPLDRFAGAPTTPETVRQQTNIRIIDVLVSALVYAGRSSVLADRPAQHSILWELPASCRVKKQEKTPGFGLTALQLDGVLRLVFLLDVCAEPGIIVCVGAPSAVIGRSGRREGAATDSGGLLPQSGDASYLFEGGFVHRSILFHRASAEVRSSHPVQGSGLSRCHTRADLG